MTRGRFGLLLLLAFGLQLLVAALFVLPFVIEMTAGERAALLAALALLLLLGLGIGLNALLNAYVLPVARLAEEAVMMAANPARRAAPHGAREIQLLASKLNAFAGAHQMLHDDVEARIDAANRALAEERNRFAALLAELPQSVLVCNLEGRILLYNARARQLLAGRRGDPAVGLGRSVYGVIDHGLIVHALEQIRHRLQQPGENAGYPIAGFVATLGGGRVVRACMAPVRGAMQASDMQYHELQLHDLPSLDGFVLTLEDITDNVEADSRRDALLLALAEGAQAALGGIRAAVEAMRTVPDTETAKRAGFIAVIDDESLRLARQLEQAVEQHGGRLEARWQLEEMRGADLVGLLARRIGAPELHAGVVDAVDPSIWLRLDSHAMVLALACLARHISTDLGVPDLGIGLKRAGRVAQLDLRWRTTAISVTAATAADRLREWENAPLTIGAVGTGLTLAGVIARHGGVLLYHSEAGRRESCYRLLLPMVEARAAPAVMPPQPGRSDFYDFDLFHQPGQTAQLDQCLLSQLSYTVFDTETTGLQPAAGDEIIAIGAVRIVNGRLLQRETFDRLVKPHGIPGAEAVAIHGITWAMLKGEPPVEEVLPQFHDFTEDTVLVGHNAAFDMRFLQMLEARTGVSFSQPVLDTLLLSQVLHPHQPQHSLDEVATRLGVAVVGRHTALGDAIVIGEVFLRMIPLLAEQDILTLKDAREAAQRTFYARLRY